MVSLIFFSMRFGAILMSQEQNESSADTFLIVQTLISTIKLRSAAKSAKRKRRQMGEGGWGLKGEFFPHRRQIAKWQRKNFRKLQYLPAR